MDIFRIEGEAKLSGKIKVSGAKNAALPIMAATILAPGESILDSIPNLSDINVLIELLGSLGAKVHRDEDKKLHIDTCTIDSFFGDYQIVRRMRASICILGPLLARFGKAEISMPGGCAIGDRPVDMHIRGLKALGATIRLENGYIIATAPEGGLVGADIFLGGPFGSSVLATANVMMAATLASGTSIIECAACEPEIEDLANFLIAMGAKIKGAGSPRLTIEGVKELSSCEYNIIPDRIEAGTFMAAAGITGSKLEIENCNLSHMMAVVDCMQSMGSIIEKTPTGCIVSHNGPIKATHITTQPYPGFPTDLQAQFMAMLAISDGNSVITEKIFPDRFMHVAEINRMNANLRKEGCSVIISGVKKLTSAPVMASDLRASAALVIGALAAKGETIINRVYHIDRGYDRIEEKLNSVGAKIHRECI